MGWDGRDSGQRQTELVRRVTRHGRKPPEIPSRSGGPDTVEPEKLVESSFYSSSGVEAWTTGKRLTAHGAGPRYDALPAPARSATGAMQRTIPAGDAVCNVDCCAMDATAWLSRQRLLQVPRCSWRPNVERHRRDRRRVNDECERECARKRNATAHKSVMCRVDSTCGPFTARGDGCGEGLSQGRVETRAGGSDAATVGSVGAVMLGVREGNEGRISEMVERRRKKIKESADGDASREGKSESAVAGMLGKEPPPRVAWGREGTLCRTDGCKGRRRHVQQVCMARCHLGHAAS